MSKVSGSILEEIQRIENIPGFVYLIRNKDLFKIGITVSMQRRMKELKPDEVVAVKQAANMRGIEKVLHKRYKHQRIPQTEYFRLSSDEVSEATMFLGGEVAAGFVVQESAKSELKELQKIASKKIRTIVFSKEVKELVDEAENLLFNILSLEGFYNELPDDETGEMKTLIGWWRSGDLDPIPRLAMNQRTIEACERRAVREDILLPIANSENDTEAAKEVGQLIDDFVLIMCWAYRNGYLDFNNTSDISTQEIIKESEARLIDGGIWYTDDQENREVKASAIKSSSRFSGIKFGSATSYVFATTAGYLFGGGYFFVSPLCIWMFSRLRKKDKRWKDYSDATLWFAWAITGVLIFILRIVNN